MNKVETAVDLMHTPTGAPSLAKARARCPPGAQRSAGAFLRQSDCVLLLRAGIRVFCSQERSQMKNRAKAMQILRNKLFDLELQKQQEDIRSRRKDQVAARCLLSSFSTAVTILSCHVPPPGTVYAY